MLALLTLPHRFKPAMDKKLPKRMKLRTETAEPKLINERTLNLSAMRANARQLMELPELPKSSKLKLLASFAYDRKDTLEPMVNESKTLKQLPILVN
jgi:hypothetical protein